MPLLESPRYLVGKGQNEEAVMIIHRLAKINGKTSALTVEQLLLAERKNSSETSGLPEKRLEVHLRCFSPPQGLVCDT